MRVDLTADSQPDEVLSLGKDDLTNSMTYSYAQGTSMAAPHVAGVIALMKALEPDLTPTQIHSVLTATARPLSSLTCRRSSGEDCGAGLIDAVAALTMVRDGEVPTSPLSFSPEVLSFGTDLEELELTLMNESDASLSWAFLRFEEDTGNPQAVPDDALSIPSDQPSSGTLATGEQTITRVVLDRSLIDEEGSYALELIFSADSEDVSLPLRFTKQIEGGTTLNGPMIVAAFLEDSSGNLILSGAQEDNGVIRDYSFDVLVGENLLITWSDENNNIEIDTGDYLGSYPDWVSVEAQATLTDLDMTLSEVVETKDVGLESGLLQELERVRRDGSGD